MHSMSRLAPTACLVALLFLAGCGAGERWGGYTQNEAKEIIADPDVKLTIIEATPRKEGQKPVAAIYPEGETLENAELQKVTMQGQEAWEYNDKADDFCLYVWFYKATNGFLAQASHCVGVPE
jgi:hypothetical protein